MKQYKINEETKNIRLDKILSRLDDDLSRTMIQKLLEDKAAM